MLFLARLDEASAAPICSWIEVGLVLARLATYFEVLAEERSVSIRIEVGATVGGAPNVWAEESLLARALSNLVSNAMRYAPRGTEIVCSANIAADQTVSFAVSNLGEPIATEDQVRIFERFVRIDASRQNSASGSGLGLAIVRSIMDLHGGSVALDSAAGQATRFILKFPAPSAPR